MYAGNDQLGMPVALLGKFAVAGSFQVIYLYSAELFPTQVRNLGIGVSSMGARLGGIFSPIVLMTVSCIMYIGLLCLLLHTVYSIMLSNYVC